MGEKDDARNSIEQSRERVSEIAEELSRRASPSYVGRQFKEGATDMARDWTERAGSSRLALAVIGGTLGALTGAAMAGRRESRSPRRALRDPYYGGAFDIEAEYAGRRRSPYAGSEFTGLQEGGFQTEEKGITERAKEKVSDMTEGAKERVSHMTEGVKERSREMKDKLTHRTGGMQRSSGEYGTEAKQKTMDTFEERPVAFTAGAILVGALFGLLAPVSRKERELIEPMKDKAREGVRKAADQAREKIEHGVGLPEGTLGGGGDVGGKREDVTGTTGIGTTGQSGLPGTSTAPPASTTGSTTPGVQRSFGEEPERPGPDTVH